MTCDATWHRLEHSGYTADLGAWRALAEQFGPAVVEVGAGCGRVSASLASFGFEVTAIESHRAFADALRASIPPDAKLNAVWGDAISEAGVIPTATGLVIFPLLVAELICGELGKAEGLTMIARSIPRSSAVAISVSGQASRETVKHEFAPPSLSPPYSYVSRIDASDGRLELTHERVDAYSHTQMRECLVSLSATDLESALARPLLDVKEVPSSEGVGHSQVVVFDAQ